MGEVEESGIHGGSHGGRKHISSQTLLQATSTMIVGHKSEISLAGIALASSIANVTGFSLLVS